MWDYLDSRTLKTIDLDLLKERLTPDQLYKYIASQDDIETALMHKGYTYRYNVYSNG